MAYLIATPGLGTRPYQGTTIKYVSLERSKEGYQRDKEAQRIIESNSSYLKNLRKVLPVPDVHPDPFTKINISAVLRRIIKIRDKK